MAALNRDEWVTLRRLYVAGKLGIGASGRGYERAGPWPALRNLRDHDPPLAREVFHPEGGHLGQNRVVITDAGTRYYEQNERLYNLIFPADD